MNWTVGRVPTANVQTIVNKNHGDSKLPQSGVQQQLRVSLSVVNQTPRFASLPTANPMQGLSQHEASPSPHYRSGGLKATECTDSFKQSMLNDALLANFPYTQDISQLPEGYSTANNLANQCIEQMGLILMEDKPGMVIDPKSGLTAAILIKKETNEVVVSFGGTTSGKKTGTNLFERSRPGKNFMTTLSQWGANIAAGLGVEPKSYRQARRLAGIVQGFHRGSVRIVGHSKGGGEAIYAGLGQLTPMKVTAFCPSHLNDRLAARIPEGNLDLAAEKVASFSPYGDPVSALRGKLPGISGLGTGYHFEGTNRDPVDVHDQFLTHVRHFCEGS